MNFCLLQISISRYQRFMDHRHCCPLSFTLNEICSYNKFIRFYYRPKQSVEMIATEIDFDSFGSDSKSLASLEYKGGQGRIPATAKPILLAADTMFLLLALSCIFDTLINKSITKYEFLANQNIEKTIDRGAFLRSRVRPFDTQRTSGPQIRLCI